MTEPQTAPTREPLRIDTPEDLRVLMGAEHAASDEQWAAITAPLRPTVVVPMVSVASMRSVGIPIAVATI